MISHMVRGTQSKGGWFRETWGESFTWESRTRNRPGAAAAYVMKEMRGKLTEPVRPSPQGSLCLRSRDWGDCPGGGRGLGGPTPMP